MFFTSVQRDIAFNLSLPFSGLLDPQPEKLHQPSAPYASESRILLLSTYLSHPISSDLSETVGAAIRASYYLEPARRSRPENTGIIPGKSGTHPGVARIHNPPVGAASGFGALEAARAKLWKIGANNGFNANEP